MELIHNFSNNKYNVVQYTNKNDINKSFQLKYPILNSDSINDISNKISTSLKEADITPDHLFLFVQTRKLDHSQIRSIEEKIIPNKILRDLIKKEFDNLDKMNNNNMKEFVKKNKSILDEQVKEENKGYLWIKKINKLYLTEYNKINI